jgi:SAM-dependent methyltransferase
MSSIDYYDKNSKDFYERTINADVQDLYRRFLNYVPKQGRILDAGCGVGRDSLFFLNKGYEVIPVDGSLEMVKLTSNLIGKDALHLLFQDIHFSNEFDAIWANASLLHVPYDELRGVMESFHKALLPSGVLYASFKYGTFMRHADDRVFFDMDEATIAPYIKGLFLPLEMWKSADTRSTVAASPDKSWLNVIARRI